MSFSEYIISAIAPLSCLGCGIEGQALCIACSTPEILPFGERCWRCNRQSLGARVCSSCRSFRGPTTVWINSDYHGLVQAAVKKYKFSHARSLAQPMASLMAQTLKLYNQASTINRRQYLVVALPTATSRKRRRGFGHSELLARHIAARLGLKNLNAIGRLDQSRQVGAAKLVRLNQLQGNYFVKHPESVANRNILLVDDVVTTGASLREAARVLRSAGAQRVDALVFAKRL